MRLLFVRLVNNHVALTSLPATQYIQIPLHIYIYIVYVCIYIQYIELLVSMPLDLCSVFMPLWPQRIMGSQAGALLLGAVIYFAFKPKPVRLIYTDS